LSENVYEGMFILDTNRYGRDVTAVSGQIVEMIQGAGGEMLVSRFWEERRLAYPIKGHRKGTYWLTYFRLDGQRLGGVEHQCKLSENILRAMFLRIDPRLVDALVAHAQAAPVAEKKPDDTAPKQTTTSDDVAAAEETEPETVADEEN